MKKVFIVLTAIYLMISFAVIANAQPSIVPIIDVKNQALLGGVRNGTFVDAKTALKSVKDGDKFSHHGFYGAENDEITVNEFIYLEVCEAYIFGRETPRSGSGIAIGKGANWNVVPRVMSQIDTENKTYTKIVSDFLKTKGFKTSEVKITQGVSVDLDGDGKNEVLLTATNQLETEDYGSGYSFVLLRKIVGKSVKNILLAGDFYPKKIASVELSAFEVGAIADLNGDGKMEIVLNSYHPYYDGGGSEVFQMIGMKAVPIKPLVTGCGFF
jgi:hypothetical protein